MSALASAIGPAIAAGEKDRRTYIGGADIGAVLGLDPYGKTPLTVYMQKIGEMQGITDPEKLKFLARRKRWEAPIVAMLREEFDGEIVSVNERYVDPEHDFLAAEIDFEWRDADGSIQNGEIKTVSPFAFGEAHGWGQEGTDEIPVHYHAQVMHGLGVTRRRKCVVCAMAGLDSMVFYVVEREDETIVGMREVAVKFWRDNVLAKRPPQPIAMTDVMLLFKKHKGCPVELDDEAAEALKNLRRVRSSIAAFKGDEEALSLQVAKFICQSWGLNAPEEAEDNARITHKGVELGAWAAGKGSHLDQKRLAADHPALKAEYTVPHYYRTFRFKKT